MHQKYRIKQEAPALSVNKKLIKIKHNENLLAIDILHIEGAMINMINYISKKSKNNKLEMKKLTLQKLSF